MEGVKEIMEIRWIDGAELGEAVKLAQTIYEQCVRYQIATAEEVGQFYGYVRAEYLWEEMTADRLFVWGVWEEGRLCGVSAMQRTGHITMLYVCPEEQHKGYGTALLRTMVDATRCLHLGQTTINVTPVGAIGFFLRRGFFMIPGGDAYPSFVSLACPVTEPSHAYEMGPEESQVPDRVTYSRRLPDTKWIVGLSAGVLCFITVATVFLTVLLS